MDKKNRNRNNGEPWSRKFGEDENLKSRQYSRSARNTKNKEVAPLLKVLLFLFLAILIIPFATIYFNKQNQNTPAPKSAEQVMINKRVASSSVESSEEASSEETSEEVSSEVVESAVEPESSIAETPSSSAAPAVVETPAETVKEPETTTGVYSNSYTIQAGDNLYRIAINHGMTLDELMQANGLSSTEAQIGMALKVK
ncbi:LysM peptidoglycan-binding domain-containing protein [Trichococcus collinsii]|uniref:LysM repeat-containing protein n=1 Tax=Trichococcus collinsii TaxID=157076 RepID=A0AB37ZWD4_9LACT|nr:LysM peptidoglycan-binding domain-containing protein [Trichococcus collinsii]CZQ83576.1 lysin motif [Trichococcus collinsii]SDZ84359.1 LysM repeat-containing protein [Trichococcus collinsii]